MQKIGVKWYGYNKANGYDKEGIDRLLKSPKVPYTIIQGERIYFKITPSKKINKIDEDSNYVVNPMLKEYYANRLEEQLYKNCIRKSRVTR